MLGPGPIRNPLTTEDLGMLSCAHHLGILGSSSAAKQTRNLGCPKTPRRYQAGGQCKSGLRPSARYPYSQVASRAVDEGMRGKWQRRTNSSEEPA